MRAARYDIVVETGAAYVRKVELFNPLPGVAASTVAAGDIVYLDGLPLPVYSVDTANGRTTLRFERGLWSDPVLTVDANALIQPAEPVTILDARAAFRISTDPSVNPPIDEPIVVTIAGDGLSCELEIDADTSGSYVSYVGAHSWDLYVQTAAWDWQRVLEGTLVVVEGDAR